MTDNDIRNALAVLTASATAATAVAGFAAIVGMLIPLNVGALLALFAAIWLAAFVASNLVVTIAIIALKRAGRPAIRVNGNMRD